MSILRSISPTTRAALAIIVLGFGPVLLLLGQGYIYWPVYLSLAAITALIALAAGRAIWAISGHPRLRNTLQGVWTSTVTLAVLLLILEAFFRLFVARSDGLAITLSHLNWLRRYWHPINSLGYRDDEWTPQAVAGRVKVLIVGDSFASGVGIDDYHQRMSNVLKNEVGDKYAVMLAANPGWDSGPELHGLESYPYPPDILVLTYYINDIDPVAAEHGLKVDNPVPAAHSPFYPLIGSSYLLNFVYFQGLRLPFTHASDTYLAYLEKAYQTPEIWRDHQGQLTAFSDWAQAHHARLIVVIFPSLLKPEETAFATQKVADTFSGVNATVIDMTPGLISEDPKDNIVNPVDPHPNESLHRRVAVDLCRAIAAMPDLPPVQCPQQ